MRPVGRPVGDSSHRRRAGRQLQRPRLTRPQAAHGRKGRSVMHRSGGRARMRLPRVHAPDSPGVGRLARHLATVPRHSRARTVRPKYSPAIGVASSADRDRNRADPAASPRSPARRSLHSHSGTSSHRPQRGAPAQVLRPFWSSDPSSTHRRRNCWRCGCRGYPGPACNVRYSRAPGAVAPGPLRIK